MVVIVSNRPALANAVLGETSFSGNWLNLDFAETEGTIDVISTPTTLYVNVIDTAASNRNDELYHVQVGTTITATNVGGQRVMTVTSVSEVVNPVAFKYFVFGINEISDDGFDYSNDVETSLNFTDTTPIVAEPHVTNMPGDDYAVPGGDVFLEGIDIIYTGSSNLDFEVLLDGNQQFISTNKSLATLNAEIDAGNFNFNLGGTGTYFVTARTRRTGQSSWVDEKGVNFGVE